MVIISCLFSLQSCDFYFDNPKEANERGFNFEPLKVRVFEFSFPLFCVSFSIPFYADVQFDLDAIFPGSDCLTGERIVFNMCLFLHFRLVLILA